MAGIRFAIAGLIVVTWTTLRNGGRVPRITRREIRDSAIVGGALLGGGMGLVAVGEQTVPSGITALLIALMPAWLAVLGWLLLRDRLPRLVVAGIALGLVGVAILVAPADGGTIDLIGVAALILSPLFWASGSLYAARRATLPSNGLFGSGIQMLAGAAILVVAGVAAGEPGRLDPSRITPNSLLALTYLVLVGSLVGFIAYGFLLRTAPLPLISTYANVNPVVAVILGVVLLAEPVGPRLLIGSVVIVVAVALIVTARSRTTRPTQMPAVPDPMPPVPDPVSPARTPAPATARIAADGPRGTPVRNPPG
jgi:drug/metabolite transporter (DMT)-like permease